MTHAGIRRHNVVRPSPIVRTEDRAARRDHENAAVGVGERRVKGEVVGLGTGGHTAAVGHRGSHLPPRTGRVRRHVKAHRRGQ